MHLPSEPAQFQDYRNHISHFQNSRGTTKTSMGIFEGFFFLSFFPGDIYEEEIWFNEEGL